jgi:hypothetical protein
VTTRQTSDDKKQIGGLSSPRLLPRIVIPIGAIKPAGLQTTFLETTSRIRTGMGRSDQVSRINSLLPPTTRYPRLTRVSEGKPLRRFLMGVKAPFLATLELSHGTPPDVTARDRPGADYSPDISSTPNDRIEQAPARAAAREPNSDAVGRSARLLGWVAFCL